MAAAVAPAGGLTEVQRVLIEALFPAMTGHPVDVEAFTPVTSQQFAQVLARRDAQFRTRGVQLMLLCALVLRPLPRDVVEHRLPAPRLVRAGRPPLDEVRARFTVTTKSAAALAAGSIGPWEPGGISPFQLSSGRTLAASEQRAYDSYGASVA